MPMAFYTTCRNMIYHFYPLTAFGSLWASFQDCPLACRLPSYYHYTVYAALRLIPKKKWFLSPTSLNTLIKIRVKSLHYLPLWHASSDSSSYLLLLGEMSSQQDISPQKSLSENSKIGSPLLPTAKPHHLIPLTYGPPPLYWLGTGRWCLSLVFILHFCLNPLLFWSSRICHYLGFV